MESNWYWVAIAALLVFCCLPMLFMGRRRNGANKRDEANKAEHEPDHDGEPR